MFGRRVAEAIGPGIVTLQRNRVGHDRKRMRDACRQAGKHTDPQAAMKTHLSQSTGAGAFDGQHGMSLAISSIIRRRSHFDGVISSAIACIGHARTSPP